MKGTITRGYLLVVFMAFMFIPVYSSPLRQEEPNPWSPGQRIPGVDVSPHTRPQLIADRNQTVHFLNSQRVVDQQSIIYTKWTLRDGWRVPIDVLESPQGDARLIGAHLDDQGILHAAFFGGDDLGASIYYASVPVIHADNANQWSEPKLVAERANTPTAGGMVGLQHGNLVIYYSGNLDGNGLYAIRSGDGGITWSGPSTIYLTDSITLWPSMPVSFVDDEGIIHLVWSVVNIQGNGEAIYYSRSLNQDGEWREPIRIAEVIRFEADTPAIIGYETDLLIVYHNDSPTTRWMQWSRDGGLTWEPPERLFYKLVGSNGPATLVKDSLGFLHMIFGNRTTDDLAIHGMWHTIWMDEEWTTPEAIVSGPRIADSGRGGEAFDPSFARAVVSQGNVLLVTWSQDPGLGSNGIWFSYRILDTPEEALTGLPTPTPSQVKNPYPTPTLTPESSNEKIEPTRQIPTSVSAPRSSPLTSIALAVIPSVVVVSAVIIIHWSRRNRPG